MTEGTDSTRDRVVEEFSSLIDDAEDMLKRANSETGDRARALRSEVEAKLLNAKLRLQELHGQAMDRARAAADATDTYVRENPWPVLGAAALVGLVIGMLVGRRGD